MRLKLTDRYYFALCTDPVRGVVPLSELSLEQIRERARYFRAMAVTASTIDTKDALNHLADRYAALALEKGRVRDAGNVES